MMWLVVPLLTASALAVAVGLKPRWALVAAAALVAALAGTAEAFGAALGPRAWLGLSAVLAAHAALALLVDTTRWRRGLRCRLALAWVVVAVLALALAGGGRSAGPTSPCRPSDVRPMMFLPLDVDATGRRMVLLSVLDAESGARGDEEALTLWTLGLQDGALRQVHRGWPFPVLDWAPDGERFVFTNSDDPWGEGIPVPFGVWTSPAAGPAQVRLPTPVDGSSFMYPQWSRRGGKLSVWRLPEAPDIGARVQDGSDLPRSFVLGAEGGAPQAVTVRGCRLSVVGAWQADGDGVYTITERGIYVWTPDGRAKRLVPAGEAPLDPFPFVIAEGVCPTGKWLAYIDLTTKGGEIDRLDCRLVDANGRRSSVASDVIPVALGWSADGRVLAAARRGRRNEVFLHVVDPANGTRRVLRTGLTQYDPSLGMRLLVSRDGRYVALNGGLEDGVLISVALVDLETGKAALVPGARMSLAAGWRADNTLVVSDTQTVSAIRPDGSGRERICALAGRPASAGVWRPILRRALRRDLPRMRRAVAWSVAR